jgi:hypothetical protein
MDTERLSTYTTSQLHHARALDYVRCLSIQHEGTTDFAAGSMSGFRTR